MRDIKVFVYGTLKRGYGNHVLLEEAEYLGRDVVRGAFRFIDLGPFPGLVNIADDRDARVVNVGGEVYRVNHDILRDLDRLEGHPDFYRRVSIDTRYGPAFTYTLPATDRYLTVREVPGLFWRMSDAEQEFVLREAV